MEKTEKSKYGGIFEKKDIIHQFWGYSIFWKELRFCKNFNFDTDKTWWNIKLQKSYWHKMLNYGNQSPRQRRWIENGLAPLSFFIFGGHIWKKSWVLFRVKSSACGSWSVPLWCSGCRLVSQCARPVSQEQIIKETSWWIIWFISLYEM